MRTNLKFLLILCLCLTSAGCAVRRKLRAYDKWATESCLKHHTAEQCKPLDYPTCLSTGCRQF